MWATYYFIRIFKALVCSLVVFFSGLFPQKSLAKEKNYHFDSLSPKKFGQTGTYKADRISIIYDKNKLSPLLKIIRYCSYVNAQKVNINACSKDVENKSNFNVTSSCREMTGENIAHHNM